MKKPVIGITCNYDYKDEVGMVSDMGTPGQDWNFVAGDYVYILEKAGAVPVIIPQYENPQNVKSILECLDGVVITGGHDVDPVCYGEFPKEYCVRVMPKRDRQDIEIANYFLLEKKKPVLGICRGIQIINVACGGTLYQDLVREGGFESHSGSRYPRNEGWHRVDFEPRSRFADIFGKSSVMVNSYHHQGVRLPGKGCEIKGKSEDGVPEAIEVMNHPFALAVQWHPEMMFDSEEQVKLLAAFVDAAKKF